MINTTEIDGRIQMLAQQRNEALDRCAFLNGLLAAAQARIKELEEAAKPAESSSPIEVP